MGYIIAIFIILFLMNLNWILVFTIFPSQVAYIKRQQIKEREGRKVGYLTFLSIPYFVWDRLMHGGWERFVIFQVGTLPSLHMRRWIYKCLGAQIGKDAVFHFKTEIRQPRRLVVGKGCIIGDNAILDARGGLFLGSNVNLSSNVSIYTLQHDHRDPNFQCTDLNATVRIGKRVWLGSNVIVLPGVNIGEGAVCCAGCVVTKDVEPYAVVAGIPAKKVNERPKDLKYNFKSKYNCRLY